MKQLLFIILVFALIGCDNRPVSSTPHECPYIGIATIEDIRVFTQGFGIHEEQYVQIVLSSGAWKTMTMQVGRRFRIGSTVDLWECSKHGTIIKGE